MKLIRHTKLEMRNLIIDPYKIEYDQREIGKILREPALR